jgi:hypothetical protein
MISRTKIGSTFEGVLRYQFAGAEDRPTDKKAEILDAEGVRTSCVEAMIRDFNRGRSMKPGLTMAVWHTSLSFNPLDAEKLDSEKMLAIALDFMGEMDLLKTQYVIVRHHDRPGHNHLHIVANRVGDDGRTIKDGRNFYRAKLAARLIIQKYALTPPTKLLPTP